MKYYKLTDAKDQTRNGTQWGEDITHKAIGDGEELCSPDVIHVYDHPLKAVMFNPIHAGFGKYHLWEVKVKKVVANDGLKVGVKQCTAIKRAKAPTVTTDQCIRFAIYCALEVYHEVKFKKWAAGWLSGTDRAAKAAKAAEAAWAAAWAAEAARAAEAAAKAAEAAAKAAEAAAWAAEAAAWAAEAARPISLVKLLKKAIKEEK